MRPDEREGGTPLNTEEALERLLRSYGAYYNVDRENPAPPFAAEAVFHSHDERFFLVKSAKLSEAESHEYVFFAREGNLTAQRLQELAEAAWATGTGRVTPHASHQSSDVLLEIVAESITPEAMAMIPKLKRYQSYRHTLHGWSHFRLFALEAPSGRMACNRQGRSLKKVFQSIIAAQ